MCDMLLGQSRLRNTANDEAQGKYHCDLCKRTFDTSEMLKLHLAQHNGNKEEQNSKVLKEKKVVVRHGSYVISLPSGNMDGYVICPFPSCETKFHEDIYFRKHLRTRHPLTSSLINDKEVIFKMAFRNNLDFHWKYTILN